MEAMELPSSPEPDLSQLQGVFQTMRVETDTLPPLVELGRKLLTKAQEGDADGVKDLMQQGAPFTTDWLGTSPLHWACQLNHIDVAELLLKAGISRDSRNKVDRTPLHCTAQEGHGPVLKLLLSYGVDVDATDMLRMTPLHWAAEYGHEDCVRLLLEHGADPCAVNKFDKTADQIAFDNNRLDITHVIQEYAESPLRQVRRKEAKERQKQYAATHKAALEVERINKQQASRMVANPKEVREVRIVKLPQMRIVSPLQMTPPKVGYESDLGFTTNKTVTANKVNNPQQLAMDTSTEKTLEMLKAHGITMLPHDEGTIVASAVQSGQKVVLTEAGKMALTLTEQSSPLSGRVIKMPLDLLHGKNVIKISPQDHLRDSVNDCAHVVEAGKMALTLTEQSSPLSGKVIKVPHDLLRGKKVIKISPQDLVKMKNEKRVIITTEKTLKPSIFVNKPVVQADKSRVEVMVKKTVVNNKPQLTSSVSVEKAAETELERLKRELEESRRQVRELQEQFRRKEREAEEYKRILDLLKN